MVTLFSVNESRQSRLQHAANNFVVNCFVFHDDVYVSDVDAISYNCCMFGFVYALGTIVPISRVKNKR